jgi:hypothetical protein
MVDPWKEAGLLIACHHRHFWKCENMRTISKHQSANPKTTKPRLSLWEAGSPCSVHAIPLVRVNRLWWNFGGEGITKHISWQRCYLSGIESTQKSADFSQGYPFFCKLLDIVEKGLEKDKHKYVAENRQGGRSEARVYVSSYGAYRSGENKCRHWFQTSVQHPK